MKTGRDSSLDEAKARVKQVSRRARSWTCSSAASSITLLDVRDLHEVNLGKIPGTLHISRGNLESKVEALIPRDANVIIYCASGNRSAFAAETMEEMGYAQRRVDGRRVPRLGRGGRRRRVTRDVARRAARASRRRAPRARGSPRAPVARSKRDGRDALRRDRARAPSVAAGEPELLMIKRAEAGAGSVERPHRVSGRTNGSRPTAISSTPRFAKPGKRRASTSRATGAFSARSTTSVRARRRCRRSSFDPSSPR